MAIRKEFKITGAVQGVGYRYYAYRNAMAMGIKGYAKNANDGGVIVVAESDLLSLDRFEEILRLGPRYGHVDGCESIEKSASGEFFTFEIR